MAEFSTEAKKGRKEKSKLIFHGQWKGAREIITQPGGENVYCLPGRHFLPLFFFQVNIPMEFFNRNVIPLNLMCLNNGEKEQKFEDSYFFATSTLRKHHKVINWIDRSVIRELHELRLIYNDLNYFITFMSISSRSRPFLFFFSEVSIKTCVSSSCLWINQLWCFIISFNVFLVFTLFD